MTDQKALARTPPCRCERSEETSRHPPFVIASAAKQSHINLLKIEMTDISLSRLGGRGLG